MEQTTIKSSNVRGRLDLCLDFTNIENGNLREAAETIFEQVFNPEALPQAFAESVALYIPGIKPGLCLVTTEESGVVSERNVVYFADPDGSPASQDVSKTLAAIACPAVEHMNKNPVFIQDARGSHDFTDDLCYFYVKLANWYLFGKNGLSNYRAGDIEGLAEEKITRRLKAICHH